VAVIDTFVDDSISELAGQLAPGRTDVRASTRPANDIDRTGHGTFVASIIAAKRNGVGVHGVAFDSRILAIRADTPGTCTSNTPGSECSFNDSALISAIDYAISQGVRVINMSLGGTVTAGNQTLENAVRRAAQAGIVVVIAAGNEGAPPSGMTPAQGTSPEEPAYIAGEAASLGRVVAVGAIDANRRITDFSNRAAQTQNFYLLAPGRRVITAGIDDNVRNPNLPTCMPGQTSGCNDADNDGEYFAISGTSFAAPHVAGALALMFDLFPSITPENALRALLDTADDYTDPLPDAVLGTPAGIGTDAVSGRGILNLQRAFAPIGASSFNFDGVPVQVSATLAATGGATGDWMIQSGAFDGLVFQDSLARGFRLDEAALASGRAPLANLSTRARFERGESRAFTVGPASLSWFAPPAEPHDPRRPWAEAPQPMFETRLGLGKSEFAVGRGGGGGERLVPGFSLAEDPSGPSGLDVGTTWTRAAYQLGPVRLDAVASSGETRSATSVGMGVSGRAWAGRLSLASAEDATTALGGRLQSRFGMEDSTRFTALRYEHLADLGAWTLGATAEAADVRLEGADVNGLWTSTWTLSAERPFADGRLRILLGQPRRAEGGSVRFDAPVEVLRSGALRFDRRSAALTPSGREVDLEASWSRRLDRLTTVETSAALITQPGHVAGADPEGAVWFSVRRAW
jgi:hypothetical protein